MLVLIGFVIVFASVIGGFAMGGGHVGVLFQPMEIVIIVGGAVGAFVAGNSVKTIKGVGSALRLVFTGKSVKKTRYLELMLMMGEVLDKVKRDGAISIENDVDSPQNSNLFKNYPELLSDRSVLEFFTDYCRFMVNGKMNPLEIEGLMESELDTYRAEKLKPAKALQKVSDGLPAFGIVAAVMGVVHVMGSVGQVSNSELGVMIAAALVGTFLGILLSYGFVGPLSTVIDQRLQESVKQFECIKVTLLAFMSGYSPEVSVEFGRKVLYSTDRPSFAELEDKLKANRKR
ncbi:flagellar motor stator protein MotA [Candidatus Saccharibacteria bacterium]|nr:flagellar motor stator protein MotA [Candidatus Saccharibacteria bacterium]